MIDIFVYSLELNFIHIYICSIHHIITTMTTIGYGDIVAKSLDEKIFEIISKLIRDSNVKKGQKF